MRGSTLVVGQSGGPTSVLNASLAGILLEAKRHAEIARVYGLVNGISGALTEDLVDLTYEDLATIRALRHTPGAALGSCRDKLDPPDYERLIRVFAAHDVRYLLYVGGNGSMAVCLRVREAAHAIGYELNVIGVPKTIDNDLAATDHSPGYGTVARFVAQSTRDTGLDTLSLRTFVPILITETMGRDTGWIAASSILAKERPEDAPHLVYVPERVFDENAFLHDVKSVYDELGWVSIVVSEGIHDSSGKYIGSTTAPTDILGHPVAALGRGAAPYLVELIRDHLGMVARYSRPGTIQRVSSAHYSRVDVEEAERVGAAAVRQAIGGDDGYMITLEREPGSTYHCRTGIASLKDVAGAERPLPDEFIRSSANGITDAFREYALPLIGEPLPRIARLGGAPVPARIQI